MLQAEILEIQATAKVPLVHAGIGLSERTKTNHFSKLSVKTTESQCIALNLKGLDLVILYLLLTFQVHLDLVLVFD